MLIGLLFFLANIIIVVIVASVLLLPVEGIGRFNGGGLRTARQYVIDHETRTIRFEIRRRGAHFV